MLLKTNCMGTVHAMVAFLPLTTMVPHQLRCFRNLFTLVSSSMCFELACAVTYTLQYSDHASCSVTRVVCPPYSVPSFVCPPYKSKSKCAMLRVPSVQCTTRRVPAVQCATRCVPAIQCTTRRVPAVSGLGPGFCSS